MRNGRHFLSDTGGYATKAALLGLSALLGFVTPGAGAENKRPGERPPARQTQTASRPVSNSQINAATRARLSESFGKLPLRFEANQGQTDSRVQFLSRGRGYTMFLTGDEAVLALERRSQKSEEESSVLSPQWSVAKHNEPRTKDNGLGSCHSSLVHPP